MGEEWSRLSQGDRRYAPDKRSRLYKQTDGWVDGRTNRLITIGEQQGEANEYSFNRFSRMLFFRAIYGPQHTLSSCVDWMRFDDLLKNFIWRNPNSKELFVLFFLQTLQLYLPLSYYVITLTSRLQLRCLSRTRLLFKRESTLNDVCDFCVLDFTGFRLFQITGL